jgi:hypothetical protein
MLRCWILSSLLSKLHIWIWIWPAGTSFCYRWWW